MKSISWEVSTTRGRRLINILAFVFIIAVGLLVRLDAVKQATRA